MERIAMSQEERDWLEWLKRAKDGKQTQREAAERMGVSERWVRRLLRRMKKQGDTVVVHGLRGRSSNRKLPAGSSRNDQGPFPAGQRAPHELEKSPARLGHGPPEARHILPFRGRAHSRYE